jgi:MFS-type transporter involved in bile tolerance (Atg22 family)
MTASPNRAEPLRLPPPGQGWANTFWVLFGVAALSAILVACAIYTAPTVVSDWQVRETAQPVPGARVSEGKCSAKIVIHICDATLGLRTPEGAVTRRVNYVFSGLHVGDYNIQVMADPARPGLVTTDLGLERLWNRTITLAVIALAIMAVIVGAIVSLIRNRRAAPGGAG